MEEENEVKLGDLRLSGKTLSECQKVFIDDGNKKSDYVIFYHTNDDGNGFEFLCVKWTGSYVGDPLWCDETTVSTVFFGTACFDGVRHMYFSNNNEHGYIYYPDVISISKCLVTLNELEKLFCKQL